MLFVVSISLKYAFIVGQSMLLYSGVILLVAIGLLLYLLNGQAKTSLSPAKSSNRLAEIRSQQSGDAGLPTQNRSVCVRGTTADLFSRQGVPGAAQRAIYG